MTDFRATLTAMFAEVEPAWREAEVAAFRKRAEQKLSLWGRFLEGERPDGQEWSYTPGDYVLGHKRVDRRIDWFEECRQRLAAGEYTVDYARAEADANQLVDAARTRFIARQGAKLESACRLRNDVEQVSGSLSYSSGALSGFLDVRCSNGDSFRLVMQVIVNYRYHRGIGQGFYQFPSRFIDIRLGNERLATRSESWMRHTFRSDKHDQ